MNYAISLSYTLHHFISLKSFSCLFDFANPPSFRWNFTMQCWKIDMQKEISWMSFCPITKRDTYPKFFTLPQKIDPFSHHIILVAMDYSLVSLLNHNLRLILLLRIPFQHCLVSNWKKFQRLSTFIPYLVPLSLLCIK